MHGAVDGVELSSLDFHLAFGNQNLPVRVCQDNAVDYAIRHSCIFLVRHNYLEV